MRGQRFWLVQSQTANRGKKVNLSCVGRILKEVDSNIIIWHFRFCFLFFVLVIFCDFRFVFTYIRTIQWLRIKPLFNVCQRRLLNYPTPILSNCINIQT